MPTIGKPVVSGVVSVVADGSAASGVEEVALSGFFLVTLCSSGGVKNHPPHPLLFRLEAPTSGRRGWGW